MGTHVKINGGSKHQREIAKAVVLFCLGEFRMRKMPFIDVKITSLDGYWGYCTGSQKIGVEKNQTIRNFVATIVHEMVHAKQYFTGEWRGTGEMEARQLQYKITDKIWKKGLI